MVRVVDRGHRVTLYGRRHPVHASVRDHRGEVGVGLQVPRSQYPETVAHIPFAAARASSDGKTLHTSPTLRARSSC